MSRISPFASTLLCESRKVAAHKHTPLHFVERWAGECFEWITLVQSGPAIKLGHSGFCCPQRPANRFAQTSRLLVSNATTIQTICVQQRHCCPPPSFSERSRPPTPTTRRATMALMIWANRHRPFYLGTASFLAVAISVQTICIRHPETAIK